jgi:hypothetical protein
MCWQAERPPERHGAVLVSQKVAIPKQETTSGKMSLGLLNKLRINAAAHVRSITLCHHSM